MILTNDTERGIMGINFSLASPAFPSPSISPSSLLASKGIFLNYSPAHFVGAPVGPISAHGRADLMPRHSVTMILSIRIV